MLRNPWTHKNIKLFFYLNGAWYELLKQLGWRRHLKTGLRHLKRFDPEIVQQRLAYYNKVNETFVPDEGTRIADLTLPRKNKAYYFDLIRYTHYFSPYYTINFQFGDVTQIPDRPTLVKSRPISGNITNAVLFKFNSIRHFTFTKDSIPYRKKKNLLIGRSNVKQEHRRAFFRMYFAHPLCDLGQINRGTSHDHWLKKKISINEHLTYKFILCQEGNDVASNLKWVMSSNSLAVMPPPKYETWFMEGTLQPNVHYVAIREDYSDLEERLTYYLDHEAEALKIIQNANEYVKRFRNSKLEKTLSLLVLEQYFLNSGQGAT
ncbi:MAG: glycosyl transferase family 90 [Bacteroidota bacterium]